MITGSRVARAAVADTQLIEPAGRMPLPGMFAVRIHAFGSGSAKRDCDPFTEMVDEKYGEVSEDQLDE